MLEILICVVALVIAGWAIAKNYDAKVVLLATGLVLLIVAVLLGHPAVSAKVFQCGSYHHDLVWLCRLYVAYRCE